ncbi:MAG: hypothetical protein ABIO22_00615 [Candidatus Saccharimonadales bacterium]
MVWGKRYIAGERQRSQLPLILTVLAVLVIAGIALVIWEVQHRPQPVAPNIVSQLSFSPFVITKGSGGAVLSQKYDAASGVYFFVMKTADGKQFTVSEQNTPVNFSEIPELYTKLLDGLHKYDTIETVNGTVSLAHPKQGESQAILNEKGVLMFIRSDSGELSKAAWKRVIESFDIYKIQKL